MSTNKSKTPEVGPLQERDEGESFESLFQAFSEIEYQYFLIKKEKDDAASQEGLLQISQNEYIQSAA